MSVLLNPSFQLYSLLSIYLFYNIALFFNNKNFQNNDIFPIYLLSGVFIITNLIIILFPLSIYYLYANNKLSIKYTIHQKLKDYEDTTKSCTQYQLSKLFNSDKFKTMLEKKGDNPRNWCWQSNKVIKNANKYNNSEKSGITDISDIDCDSLINNSLLSS